MSTEATIKLIDTTVAALSAALNFVGASQTVSATIAARIAEGGREWTDAERAAVQAELDAAKAYAAQQIAAAHGGQP
jgi:hypothetical protein